MDSNFTIKPRANVQKPYAPRDPVPVRGATETDLDPAKAVSAPGDPGQRHEQPPHQDHAPHDVVADPESREVINRENDVRTHAGEEPHPDQALLRQRAY